MRADYVCFDTLWTAQITDNGVLGNKKECVKKVDTEMATRCD